MEPLRVMFRLSHCMHFTRCLYQWCHDQLNSETACRIALNLI